MLHYMHQNNDIIMHVNVVKTFWHPLLLILWWKKTNLYKTAHKYFQSNLYCTEPILSSTATTGIHENSCLLQPVHGYLDSYSYQCGCGVRLGTVWQSNRDQCWLLHPILYSLF